MSSLWFRVRDGLSPGFKTSEDDTAIAVGVEKGSDLTEEINKALKDISEDERTEIMDQAIKNQPAEQ